MDESDVYWSSLTRVTKSYLLFVDVFFVASCLLLLWDGGERSQCQALLLPWERNDEVSAVSAVNIGFASALFIVAVLVGGKRRIQCCA